MRKLTVGITFLWLAILPAHAIGKSPDHDNRQETIVVTSKTMDASQVGLRIFNPRKSFDGYTLFSHLSLELPGTIKLHPIYLIDMQGNIRYQWMTDFETFHAQLKPNGHLVYSTAADIEYFFKTGELYDPLRAGHGLRELDLRGKEIWYFPVFVEHDFQILQNDNILIEEGEAVLEPHAIKDRGFIKDSRASPHFDIITPAKTIVWSWHAEAHINELRKYLSPNFNLAGDWAHSNTCEMIKESLSGKNDNRFRKGNILFSFPKVNLIGVIDYTSGKIVWAWGPGELEGQHSPTMLENGNILIFDNGRNRGWSRVIELDPIAERIVWEYHSEPKAAFFSPVLSSAEPLPNGNILITEATKNRIFEITPKGEIVWDFISTYNKMSGGEGIYHSYRYSPGYVKPLFEQMEKS